MRLMTRFALGTAGAMAFVAATPASAAACSGVTFGSDFAGAYNCNNLGTPTGVSGLLGGVAFLNNNTLLVGGNANSSNGYIASIGVTRDAGNHIIGFSAPSAVYAQAPNIDGGLAFGPGGVLFATGYPTNTLMQFKPGSNTPDKSTNLVGVTSSVGSLQFVPAGFGGAGKMKIVSYSSGEFYDAVLTPDGNGTFNITATKVANISGGPEGMVYVGGANNGFGVNSLLVSEYAAGTVSTYESDANGNPIVASRRVFLSGLSGAEGALIDPLTGDFIFSTFGSGNNIFVVSGFQVPNNPGVPEPASWALMIAGFGMAGGAIRARARKATVSIA